MIDPQNRPMAGKRQPGKLPTRTTNRSGLRPDHLGNDQAARITRLQTGRSGKPRGEKGKGRRASRRSHPAKVARATALLASITATGGIGAAMAYADGDAETEVAATALAPVPMGSLTSALEVETAAIDDPLPKRSYRDGSWLGTAEPTRWGDVQVQVTTDNGQLVDITVIQIPNDRRSTSINNAAAPILKAQAIAVQGADLDIVSGATYTSQNYAASLQAALDQAAGASSGTADPRDAGEVPAQGSTSEGLALQS